MNPRFVLIPLVAALSATTIIGQALAIAIETKTFQVEVNELGVLTQVPADGLRTVDGPVSFLEPGFAEWFSVWLKTDTNRLYASASGTAPDWADRTPIEPVSQKSVPGGARFVSSVDDLRITTEFWTDDSDTYLISQVTLSNHGNETMRDVFYMREVRPADGAPGWSFPSDFVMIPAAPPDIQRSIWMLDDIPPGESRALGFSYTPISGVSEGPEGVDVPLALWTHPDFPGGLNFGATRGISYGDYDADGFIDVFALMSANLWRNINGETWELVADLDSVLPFATNRYGAAFGDYNNDGLPDIGTEGRKEVAIPGSDISMHLLKNLGNTQFEDVAENPKIIDDQGWGDQESICWGDVDCDTDLDMFLPVYPAWAAGNPGNFFYRNLGPVGAGGEYIFQEFSAEADLDNPSSPVLTARPEGAQFVDIDFDGDMDLYSNGTLYQNNSTIGLPDFDPMFAGSGIGFSTVLEEGAAFADYDMDGDYDLLIVYTPTGVGVRIWENRGNGYFFLAEQGIVESPFIGLNLGLSTEDWDNDGDMDFTTRQVFRRNMLMETGERSFIVATTSIPAGHITSATPSWGDWDKDGDLDSALGNWLSTGHFYENTLYNESTPDAQRRYVRVRTLRDSDEVPGGLETEYATSVEIVAHGEENEYRRKKFTASSAGYLNQNEYTLHFALPNAPEGGEEVHFDVVADFPNLPAEGMWRVDKHVNPALGDIDFATLTDREIVVFRSGVVSINGATFQPITGEDPLLTIAGGGLVMTNPDTAVPAPADAPGTFHYVGIDMETVGAPEPVRIREVILDGQLAAPSICGEGSGNMFLWDVTDIDSPMIVEGGIYDGVTSSRNHRSYFHTDWLLETDRHYRLVAHVDELRSSDFVGPVSHENLTVHGGLSFADAAPCTGESAAAASVDSDSLYLTFRFAPLTSGSDLDGDGLVNFADLLTLLANWGDCPKEDSCDADLNGDGTVGFEDLLILLVDWTG